MREPTHDRIDWGNRLQRPILEAVGDLYRLKIADNTRRRQYCRRAPVGHTRDGLMFRADVGKTVVEAKNTDYFVWKDTWTTSAAPQHIELQVQTGMYADDAPHGIIACLVGGNDLKVYERPTNRPLQQQIIDEAQKFLDDVAHGREPDPVGTEADLPALMALYPETVPDKVIEDLTDPGLRDMLRMFERADGEEKFWGKVKADLKPKILARAEDAAMIRAHSIICRIQKVKVSESTVPAENVLECARNLMAFARERWGSDNKEWPTIFREVALALRSPLRVSRKASVQTRLTFSPVEGDPPLPGDDPVEDAKHTRGIAA